MIPSWHARILESYDAERREICLHDPKNTGLALVVRVEDFLKQYQGVSFYDMPMRIVG